MHAFNMKEYANDCGKPGIILGEFRFRCEKETKVCPLCLVLEKKNNQREGEKN